MNCGVGTHQLPLRNAITEIGNALKNIQNLEKIQIYSHGGHDINLTNESFINKSGAGNYAMAFGAFRPANPTSNFSIDLFACGCSGAPFGQPMADASGGVVRTAAPGLQVKVGSEMTPGTATSVGFYTGGGSVSVPVSGQTAADSVWGAAFPANDWVNWSPGGNGAFSEAPAPTTTD